MSRNKYPEQTVNRILEAAQALFLEKGYENTSIQDILERLGNLSKGAIYHHFSSKEDILNAVGNRYNEQIVLDLMAVRDDNTLSGQEKLQKMFRVSLSSSDRDILFSVVPDMTKNPKLLVFQLEEIFQVVAPDFVLPVIRQGIQDGSIQTQYPKELAEVITLLANIWLNPMVIQSSPEELVGRVKFFDVLLKTMGMDLLDEDMLNRYIAYCGQFKAAQEKEEASSGSRVPKQEYPASKPS